MCVCSMYVSGNKTISVYLMLRYSLAFHVVDIVLCLGILYSKQKFVVKQVKVLVKLRLLR